MDGQHPAAPATAAPIGAAFFDGRSARRHAVELDLSGGRIAISGAVERVYALDQARLAEPFGDAPCVLDFDDGARLEAPRSALPQLQQALRYRRSLVERWQQHWPSALMAIVLMVASVGALARWGVPWGAEQIVAMMPVSVDRQAGEHALATLEGQLFFPSKLPPRRIAEVRAVFDSVKPADSRMPLQFHVMQMRGDIENAFALPDGTIVMSDAMIEQVADKAPLLDAYMKAQLAGILAHEIGHVQGRHGMRSLVRGSLLGIGSAALFGDFSVVVAGMPVMLMNMDYSREMERAADEFAIGYLRARGIPTAPLADLFDALDHKYSGKGHGGKGAEKQGSAEGARGSAERVTDYLSSHPANAERSARLRAGTPPPSAH